MYFHQNNIAEDTNSRGSNEDHFNE